MSFYIDKDREILELEARRTIYYTVKKFAGAHFREIQRKSGLATGSVKYHLDYLTKHKLIKMVKEGNNVIYFPNEFSADNEKLLLLLRQASVRSILLYIAMHKNCIHEDIVKFVKLSPSTVSWHLKKLISEDIISFEKKGRKTFYKLLIDQEEILGLLITYKESFVDALVNKVIDMWDFE